MSFALAQTGSDPLVAPHELLGLPATEHDVVRIVEAAQARLRMLTIGHELEVRRQMSAMIRQARDQMVQALIQSSRARGSAPSGLR